MDRYAYRPTGLFAFKPKLHRNLNIYNKRNCVHVHLYAPTCLCPCTFMYCKCELGSV